MTDIERLLTEAFQKEADRMDPDLHKARQTFLERRRKRRIGFAFSGVALAGASVAAALFVASSVPSPTRSDEIDLASAIPKVVASAPVSGAPEAAAVVSDGVWIANAEPGLVSKIDSATNEVVASVRLDGSSGTPDEIVAVGSSLAVTTTDGFIHILDAATADASDYATKQGIGPISMDIDGPTQAARPSETFRLDLDVAGDTVWVANENNGFIYGIFDAGSGSKDFTGEPVEDIAPNDIAVGDGRVFGLDGDRGKVAVFDITSEPGPPKLERSGTFDAPSGAFLDMRYGFGKLWISDESGQVFAYDPDSGEELSAADVGGRYSDLVIDGDSVWALPGGGEGAGSLVAIDPETGSPRNEGVAIEGNPVDVVSGLGSLWVVDKDGAAGEAAGSLLRVDPTGVGTPSPEPEPDETEGAEEDIPSEGAQIVFAYSAGGDIFTEYEDGTTVQLTATSDEEINPEFGLNSIFFERHDSETGWFGIIEHDLLTGEEEIVVEMGNEPAVSPGGDLAWVDTTEESGDININIAPALDDGPDAGRSYSFRAGDLYTEARSLEWSDDARTLYFQAKGEGWVTLQAQIPEAFNESAPSKIDPFVLNGINDQPPGSTLIQPANATVEAVDVANVCCREVEGDPYSQVRIGKISSTEGGATYSDLSEPIPVDDADPDAVGMFGAHQLAYVDGAWDVFSGARSWIVSYAGNVWLVNEDGGIQHLGGPDGEDLLEAGHDPGFSGFTLNPTLEGY